MGFIQYLSWERFPSFPVCVFQTKRFSILIVLSSMSKNFPIPDLLVMFSRYCYLVYYESIENIKLQNKFKSPKCIQLNLEKVSAFVGLIFSPEISEHILF